MVTTAAPPEPDCGTGTGNSPPARKLAFWPESAVRLGSERMLTVAPLWIAVPPVLKPTAVLPGRLGTMEPLDVLVESRLLTAVVATVLAPPLVRPQAMVPLLFTFCQLAPSCFNTVVPARATFTCRLIGLGALSCIWLTSCFGSGT